MLFLWNQLFSNKSIFHLYRCPDALSQNYSLNHHGWWILCVCVCVCVWGWGGGWGVGGWGAIACQSIVCSGWVNIVLQHNIYNCVLHGMCRPFRQKQLEIITDVHCWRSWYKFWWELIISDTRVLWDALHILIAREKNNTVHLKTYARCSHFVVVWYEVIRNSPLTKWPQFHKRHYQMHFHEWKTPRFDSNFTEVCS